ncbi:MAG: tetraacyldisaccharide 4'-kinase [Planctomycetes bacterium]|nr:tetraacyldisaccharide 4'-kinase [Planctomycetota bacterium]
MPPSPIGQPHSARAEERLAGRGGARELLRLPAYLFGALVHARARAYDRGLKAAHAVGVPVLSVGNLSVGGTGKTPFCIWVVRELQRLGAKPGLLSRGYRAGGDGRNEEALVFSAACPGVPHVQDPDRVRGARALVARGLDVIVLDDGFQHRRLAREQDWVLVDALRPWGLPRDEQGESVRALLPRGLLREPLEALARADAVVITRASDVPERWLAELERELAAAAPGKPILHAAHRPARLVDARGVEHPLGELADRAVELVSGVGNPQAFESTLRSLGARVGRHHAFPDHHHYTSVEALALAREAHASECALVTTRKDAVKLLPLGLDCLVLEIELELVRGEAQARALLAQLAQRSDARA